MMLETAVVFVDMSANAIASVQAAATVAELRQAAFIIDVACDLMPFMDGPAPRGDPPHSHTGQLRASLAAAIRDDGTVIVGPQKSQVGERGMVLEFAGRFDVAAARDEFGQFLRGHSVLDMTPRVPWAHPFMKPAMERAMYRLPDAWAMAIGST
jgi:hypothetical protein